MNGKISPDEKYHNKGERALADKLVERYNYDAVPSGCLRLY